MVSKRAEKPICAPPRLSEVSPTLPLKQFQCSSDWWWPSLVLSMKSDSSFKASLLQEIHGVMSLALCPQVVSQASQHFRSFETHATWGWWHVWSDRDLLRQSSGEHGWLLPPPLSRWRLRPYRLHSLSSWIVVAPCLTGKPHPDWSLVTEPSVYTMRSCALLFSWRKKLDPWLHFAYWPFSTALSWFSGMSVWYRRRNRFGCLSHRLVCLSSVSWRTCSSFNDKVKQQTDLSWSDNRPTLTRRDNKHWLTRRDKQSFQVWRQTDSTKKSRLDNIDKTKWERERGGGGGPGLNSRIDTDISINKAI